LVPSSINNRVIWTDIQGPTNTVINYTVLSLWENVVEPYSQSQTSCCSTRRKAWLSARPEVSPADRVRPSTHGPPPTTCAKISPNSATTPPENVIQKQKHHQSTQNHFPDALEAWNSAKREAPRGARTHSLKITGRMNE
jgi:hypothetical protein